MNKKTYSTCVQKKETENSYETTNKKAIVLINTLHAKTK